MATTACSHSEYRRIVSTLPRPSPEQVENFVQFVSDAHSWYKHQPGDRIGRYKLLEKIGEGGCSIVFMAEQEEPVRRRVAFKVIKPGMGN